MIYLTKDVLPLFVWLFLWGNSCSPLQGHADEITPYGEKTYLESWINLFPQRLRLWFTTSTLSLACATNRLRRKATFGQLMDLWVNSQISIIRKATIVQLMDSWAKPIPATVLPPQINQAPILGAQITNKSVWTKKWHACSVSLSALWFIRMSVRHVLSKFLHQQLQLQWRRGSP